MEQIKNDETKAFICEYLKSENSRFLGFEKEDEKTQIFIQVLEKKYGQKHFQEDISPLEKEMNYSENILKVEHAGRNKTPGVIVCFKT